MHDWQDKGQMQTGNFGTITHGINAGNIGFEKLIGDDAPLTGDASRLGEGCARPQADSGHYLVGKDLSAIGKFKPVTGRGLPDAFYRRAKVEFNALALQRRRKLSRRSFRQ